MDEQYQPVFEKLFHENHKALCSLAYNLVGDLDAAKDIVQEVFLRLWKRKNELKFDEGITGYLKKATTHSSYNYLETRKGRQRILSELKWPKFLDPADDRLSVSFQELEKLTHAAIDKLPPRCKVIFLLSRHEQMKYREIAEQLDISVKTVEHQMGIALEKIRSDLRPYLTREFIVPMLILLALLATIKIIL